MMADNSIDAIVTDPPYDLISGSRGGSGRSNNPDTPAGRHGSRAGGFMGLSWDATGVAFDPATWREALRVLQPGGHVLAFGGTRTYHRMVSAMEEAGFEVRDCVVWLYAQGFPKSLNVSAAIDKQGGGRFGEIRAWLRARVKTLGLTYREIDAALGNENSHKASHYLDNSQPQIPSSEDWAVLQRLLQIDEETDRPPDYSDFERQIVGHRPVQPGVAFSSEGPSELPVTLPATAEAARWEGWGTSLKPSFEPIVLCRKPFKGTVASNVLEHGTGALNIGACRIGRAADDVPGWHQTGAKGSEGYQGSDTFKIHDMSAEEIQKRCGSKGRWPANAILSHSDRCQLVGTRKVKGCLAEVIQGGKDGGGFDVGSSDGTRHTVFEGYGDADGMEEVDEYACVPGCPVRMLEDQAGNRKSGKAHVLRRRDSLREKTSGWGMRRDSNAGHLYGDQGGASRFYYCPKPSKREKTAGLEAGMLSHPTTKPVELCRYLCRLITPPGGTVLDMFAGSGTTGVAALREGFQFLGIEAEEDYYQMMRARLAHTAKETEEC